MSFNSNSKKLKRTTIVLTWSNKKLKYDCYWAYFSTLGGAYSSLGEDSETMVWHILLLHSWFFRFWNLNVNVFNYSFLSDPNRSPFHERFRWTIKNALEFFDGKGRSETIAISRNERITLYLYIGFFLIIDVGLS